MPMRRFPRLLAAGALLIGCASTPVLLDAESAQAVACGTPVAAGTPCTLTGTATLTAGTLALTSPAALAWTATENGLNQQVVDATTGQQTYLVNDATGSGAGWHVTLSATTFTSTSPAATLANTGTFSTNGSVTSEAAAGYPTAACSSGATCVLPTHVTAPTTFPVLLTTATSPTAVVIYDADASSGMGSIVIGGSGAAAPVGWWVNIPASAVAATYTSTVTLQVLTAP
jgi:hypothetical protein